MTLAGLHVNLADNCACGARESVVGADQRLSCVACGADRGRLGPRTTAFITEITKKFGAPAGPINLRRPVGEIESTDLVLKLAPGGRLLNDWLRRRQRRS